MISPWILFLIGVVAFALLAFLQPCAAQPPLPRRRISFISPDGARRETFEVEVAKTSRQQAVGLMFRRRMPRDGGMLFLWKRPGWSLLWMRNTPMPLDMVFVDDKKAVMRVVTRRPFSWSTTLGPRRSPFMIELHAQSCAKLGIGPGWTVQFGPSLAALAAEGPPAPSRLPRLRAKVFLPFVGRRKV